MNLQAIEALIEVAEAGTIAEAARRLGISRAAVRRRLDGLEADLGVPLMFRGQGQPVLTAPGALLVERGRALLDSAAEVARAAQAVGTDAAGAVRFVVLVGIPARIGARAAVALGRLHENLRLQVTEADDPLQHLGEDFDLLLYAGPPLEGGAVFTRALIKLELGLLASARYLESRGTPATIADLDDHRLLVWQLPRTATDVLPGPDGARHPVTPALRSANTDLLLAAAAADGGIAWCPVDPPDMDAAGRALIRVLPDQVRATVAVWLVCPMPSRLDPRLRALIDVVLRTLNQEGLPPVA